MEAMIEEAAAQDLIPLRIRCPECKRIYTIFIKDFDQGLHVILGQACPFCKRFIKESDRPDEVLADAKEIREALKKDNEDRTI